MLQRPHLTLYILVSIVLFSALLAFTRFQAADHDKTEKVEWTVFRSDEAKFIVQFPSDPAILSQTIVFGKDAQEIGWESFSGLDNDLTYRVDYLNVAETLDTSNTEKQLTDYAKLLISLIAPTSSTNPRNPELVKFNGYPALEFDFRNLEEKKIIKMIAFLVDNKLYALSHEFPEKSEQSNFKKFKASFALIR